MTLFLYIAIYAYERNLSDVNFGTFEISFGDFLNNEKIRFIKLLANLAAPERPTPEAVPMAGQQ